MGVGRYCNKLYLIDFGLVKKYCDIRLKFYILYCEDKNLMGMVCYVSINVYFGIE